jgi:hypothetical protein
MLSTLSCSGHRHSEETTLYTRNVVHKAGRLDQERIEEINRKEDSSGPRRQPQTEEGGGAIGHGGEGTAGDEGSHRRKRHHDQWRHA